MEAKESVDKLLAYQQELRREENFLKEALAKINAQHHALRVEELHLLNALKNSNNENKQTTTKPPPQPNTDGNLFTVKTKLDLSVPQYIGCDEADEEMEEEDD